MTKRRFTIIALGTICLATILAAVPTNSLVGYYDPWLDYDENGDIDVKDVAASARAFGSSGDPTKYVNVTNWPTSNQVCVWWNRYVPVGALGSPNYKSLGFCRLHILAWVNGLTGSESVKVYVQGIMRNEDHTGSAGITAYTITLTASSPAKDATIFVPSETFTFSARRDSSDAVRAYLNFYLTWA